MRSFHRRSILGLPVLLAGGLGAFWWQHAEPPPSLARVRAAGALRIGYAIEAPYALLDPQGQPTGESPGVARAVATRLGLGTRWVLTSFDQLIPDLERDRFDLIAAGLFVTPARARRVRFSRPTLAVRPGWLTRADQPLNQPYEAVQPRADWRVAVLQGSVEEAGFLQRQVPAAGLLTVPDAQSGLGAVLSGEARALALSLPTVRAMALASAGRLTAQPAVGPHTPIQQVALALSLGAADLDTAIDQVLASYLGSPAHLALLSRWGLGRDDLPPARSPAA